MSSFWKDRTAFVTGATGFVGAHVVRRLVDREARVVCLQRDAARVTALDLLGLRDRVTVVHGAVEDLDLCARVLHEYDIDAVFHLAAQALVGPANRAPLSTFESNVRGTYRLLEACRLSDRVRRIVVASSDKAYGSHEALPYTEEFPLRGLFPYDASKACTDLIAQSYAAAFDMPVSITRSANIYGPADPNLSRIVPGTIIAALDGTSPVIRSDGSPIRDYLYVDDIAEGYLLLAEQIERAKGRAWNFGTGTPVTVLDLVTQIVALAATEPRPVPTILADAPLPGEIPAQYLSAAAVERAFGWRARTSLDEGLRQTIAWYAAHRTSFRG
jgi:CDP-glucose 4,6-dehydratase